MPDLEHIRRPLVVVTFLLLTGIGILRVVSTYKIFSQTYDEAAGVAAGVEWVQRGSYEIDDTQPPLARIAVGLALTPSVQWPTYPPQGLAITWGSGNEPWVRVGNQILDTNDGYVHKLALARAGVLPFFFITSFVVFLWALRVFDDIVALSSTLLFTSTPPVLAHAGLATNDMAFTATFVAAMMALVCLLERQTYSRSVIFGLTAGLSVLSKFSALAFVPAGILTQLCVRRWFSQSAEAKPELPRLRMCDLVAIVLVIAGLTVWAGYRFSVHITRAADRPHENIDSWAGKKGPVHQAAYFLAEHIPFPAPQFFDGMTIQKAHAARGALSYLLGRVGRSGWWYYFPVAFAVKTPIAFLLLIGIGLAALFRGKRGLYDWRAIAPGLIALILLLLSMTTKLDLGVRLILPLYALLALVGGYGTVALWNMFRPKWAGPSLVVILLGWQLISSVLAHPDYLAYFNALAGPSPDRVLVDTDLDWGQDLLRLANVLKSRKVDSVSIAYFGSADLNRHDLPHLERLLPYHRATGWIAISESASKFGGDLPPYRGYEWLDTYTPVEQVGRSIRLYYISESSSAVVAP